MFRLFRRGKKDKKKEKAEPKVVELPSATELSEPSSEDSPVQEMAAFATSETPFEERFAGIPGMIVEEIPEEIKTPEIIHGFLPFVENVVETEVSFNSFISPELLKLSETDQTASDSAVFRPVTAELPPITLEERIEGALFSVGRPIHTDELIESLQEESPLVKRTIRKLSRLRKKTSPIVIDEISKDRWVLQLNPVYHEFFQLLSPKQFMTVEERRILTEIAYRQPISLAMIKKIVRKIGPIKITEICRHLEAQEYIVGEKRARSMVYTSTPKFAHDFGFDNESRRLKLQMLWRLRRLMGDYEVEEDEEEQELVKLEEEEIKPTEPEDQALVEGEETELSETEEEGEEEEIKPTDPEDQASVEGEETEPSETEEEGEDEAVKSDEREEEEEEPVIEEVPISEEEE